MIIVQPELNIDVFMQTLGRVFRTGQVTPPAYQFLISDLPSEKRPAAVLGKKMASLNANTTANRKSAQTFENIPDFLNEYGDMAASSSPAGQPRVQQEAGQPHQGSQRLGKRHAKVTDAPRSCPSRNRNSSTPFWSRNTPDTIAMAEAHWAASGRKRRRCPSTPSW